MRTPWIAVFTENDFDRNYLCKSLNALFNGLLEAIPVTIQTVGQLPGEPLAVAVNLTSRAIAANYFPNSHIIYMHRSFTGANLEQLVTLPAGERVLVVNKPQAIAEETVEDLRSLGIHHLELTAYWPGADFDISGYDTVVYPGFRSYCPEGKRRYIDLGYRYINQSSLTEVIKVYNLPTEAVDLPQTRSARQIVDGLYRIQQALESTRVMKENFEQVCFLSANAILNVDGAGQIVVFNPAAEKLFGVSYREMIGFPYQEKLRTHRQLLRLIERGEKANDELIYIHSAPVLANIRAFTAGGEYMSISLAPVDALKRSEEKARSDMYKKGFVAHHVFEQIQGSSPAIRRSIAQARYYAQSEATVLITGESGTGKELFAQAIHNASSRANGPFVAANFAAIPENLIESELFGYDEGAFTGAVKGGKPGLFRSAHKGTLFLDEIGDASPSLQSRLLRAIEEREIMPVGSSRVIPVDVRILCATNKPLSRMVAEGRFREDLYYRLKVFKLHVPPLRDRLEDIPLILNEMTGGVPLPDELLRRLRNYSWPGNIRELRGIAQYLTLLIQKGDSVESLPWEEILFDFFEREEDAEAREPVLLSEDLAILSCIREQCQNGQTVGRCSLARCDAMRALGLTESKLKGRLKRLEQMGYLKAGRTRQGVALTAAAQRRLEQA